MARTREELVWSVKSAYYALLGIQRMVRALEQSKRALEEHYRRTEDLVRAKKAARVDLLKIDVRLATMKYRLFAQRGRQRIGRRALCTLLGIGSIRTEARLVKGSLTFRRPVLDIRKLTAGAVTRRADLRELRYLARAQAARVDSARAGYWPVVSASLTFGLRLSAQGEYDDLGFAGLTISYPLLGWLSTAPKVDEASAELGVLREKIRKLALAIQRDVEVAVIKVRTAVAQIEATRRSIVKAREVLRVEREKAAVGSGTTRDVLDAQADLLLAETSYFQGLAGFQTALALLELATGNDR
jgi:outer membrane protein